MEQWSGNEWFVGGIIAIWTTAFVVGCVWLMVVGVREKWKARVSEEKKPVSNGNGTKLATSLVTYIYRLVVWLVVAGVAVDIINGFTGKGIPSSGLWDMAKMAFIAFTSIIDPNVINERIKHGVQKHTEESGRNSG